MVKDGGSHWIVASDEHSGSPTKIPFVCNHHEKAPCIRFQGLMLAEGWQFRQPISRWLTCSLADDAGSSDAGQALRSQANKWLLFRRQFGSPCA